MKTPDPLRALYYYGSMEANWIHKQMADLYTNNIYGLFLPENKEGSIAIDLGANIGIVSMYLGNNFEKVISLEPCSEHFDALSRNIVSNGYTNIKPLKLAVSKENGKATFSGQINRTVRSLVPLVWGDDIEKEEVETIDMATLFEREGLDHVDFVKMDIEGSEAEVLASEGFERAVGKIDSMFVEIHKWNGRNPNQIIGQLEDYGFKVDIAGHDQEVLFARKIK